MTLQISYNKYRVGNTPTLFILYKVKSVINGYTNTTDFK
jgi:hypothetical protein